MPSADSQQVTVNRLSISSSPFPSPASAFFPPPILSPHEYALISSTSKRNSRMNAGNDTETPSAQQIYPATPKVMAAGKPADATTPGPVPGDDKEDRGRGADLDVTCLRNGGVSPGPLLPKSPSGEEEATNDDSDSPTTPLASNQNPPKTIIQPSSPPTIESSSLDGLRSSRNSLTSTRPAPPSPALSRRTSAALSRTSTRSRPNSIPAFSTAPANLHDPESSADADPTTITSANPGAPTPKTPTPAQPHPQQQQARKASSALVKIRDFAFPDDDPRHNGTGPLTPRPNRRLQRPLSTWSTSSTSSTSSNDDRDDHTSSGGGASSYGFAGWGLGRLSWFGVRSASADGGSSSGGGGGGSGPSQGDFERNFEDAVSPSYEIDDPYGSLDDDDDDFDDYVDNDVGGDDDDGHAGDRDVVERLLLPGMYRALYAFEPEGTAEMALEEDQIVRVVGRGGGVGWAIVARGSDGGHALVPEGYLELVSLDQEQLEEEDG